MSVFWFEFLFFLASSLAILVSISSFALFIITLKYERKLQTIWRALGFLVLALAFFLFVLERKYPGVEIFAVIIEAFALFFIFKGVLAEPRLTQLKEESKALQKLESQNIKRSRKKQTISRLILTIVVLVILAGIFLIPGYLYVKTFLASVFELIAVIFVIATIVIQVRRYLGERVRQNLWPLLGYIFLLVRGIAMIFYRLPELDLVFFRQLSLEYSFAWQIALICTLGAFIFLGIWAWNFVKVRLFLRTYVVFISIIILVSTLGSLIFTLFIFQVLENNNLDLMLKGAETEAIIMNDRANTAMFLVILQ